MDPFGVTPRDGEVAVTLPGDGIVPDAEVVMDRAFDLPAGPAASGHGSPSSARDGRVGTSRAGPRSPYRAAAVPSAGSTPTSSTSSRAT